MKLNPTDLQNAWNVNCGDLPKCHDIHHGSRHENGARLLEKYDHDLVRIVAAIKKVAASRFCNGLTPSATHPNGFRASFDWFLKPGTMLLVEEGQFAGPKEFTEPDAGQTSPADLSYFSEPPPKIFISDEEFLRAQVHGRLLFHRELITKERAMTPATKHRINYKNRTDDFCQKWISEGGSHPWATAEQIDAAIREVVELRKKNAIPSHWGQFNPQNPKTSFKEFRQQRDHDKADW